MAPGAAGGGRSWPATRRRCSASTPSCGTSRTGSATHEAQRRFDARFIELARAVYLHNDERAAIKQRINLQLSRRLIEEKSYQPYR